MPHGTVLFRLSCSRWSGQRGGASGNSVRFAVSQTALGSRQSASATFLSCPTCRCRITGSRVMRSRISSPTLRPCGPIPRYRHLLPQRELSRRFRQRHSIGRCRLRRCRSIGRSRLCSRSGALYEWRTSRSIAASCQGAGAVRNLRERGYVATDGRLVFTSVLQVRQACLAGFGLAYLPLEYVSQYIEARELVEVLADWRKTFKGYHLYYPSRRQPPPALAALIDALRYRG